MEYKFHQSFLIPWDALLWVQVFVYPVQNQCLSSLVNEKNEPHSTEDNSLVAYDCKELYLQLAPLKNGLPMKISNTSPIDFSAAKSHHQFGNENVASPTTPNGLKLSSLSDLSSPIFEDSSSSVPNQKSQSLISFDLREALGDESSKKLLQTCAASWLYSRWLLLGNIVFIQIISELCVFQVIGAKRVSVETDILLIHQVKLVLHTPEVSDISEHINQAIIVNRETKVSLSLASNVTSDGLIQTDLSKVELWEKGTKASVPNNISKLGDLSKEYAVLKDIILSSVKNDLLSNFELRTTKGVLHSSPGTGKTSLAQLCVHDVGVNLFQINGPEIVGQYYGESEQALHEVFDSAIQAAPAVVFIDELDAIAPARKDGGDELSQRMVAPY